MGGRFRLGSLEQFFSQPPRALSWIWDQLLASFWDKVAGVWDEGTWPSQVSPVIQKASPGILTWLPGRVWREQMEACKSTWGLEQTWHDGASVFCLSNSVTRTAKVSGMGSTTWWEGLQSHIAKRCGYKEGNTMTIVTIDHISNSLAKIVHCNDCRFLPISLVKNGVLVDFNLHFSCYEWNRASLPMNYLLVSFAHFSITLLCFISWFFAAFYILQILVLYL